MRWGLRMMVGMVVVGLACPQALSAGYEVGAVEYLDGYAYFVRLRAEIERAKRSIFVVTYLMQTMGEGEPKILLEELGKRARAGVAVQVILDEHLKGSEGRPKNDPAVAQLRSRGIQARYDQTRRVTHVKMVVIDEETVILGSQNWTTLALGGSNEEVGVMVRSKVLAQDLVRGLYERIGNASMPLAGSGAEEMMDINRVDASVLARLPGIGPKMAQKIIEYREENGPFGSLEDLSNVKGIGPKIIEKLKDKTVVR